MTFALVIGGGLGGLLGSLAAHLLVICLARLGHSDAWLRGAYGPPFFNLSLFNAVVYAGIGMGLSRRLRLALLGFLGPFCLIALPLTLLSRSSACAKALEGEFRFPQFLGLNPEPGWYWTVVVLLTVSVWMTIYAMGFEHGPQSRRLSGIAAAAGAMLGYGLLSGLLWAVPRLRPQPAAPFTLTPQPVVLLDGLLTGAGMGLGLSLAGLRSARKGAS